MVNYESIDISSVLPEVTLVGGAIFIILLGLVLKQIKVGKLYNNAAILVTAIAWLLTLSLYKKVPLVSFNGMIESNFLIISFKLIILTFCLFTLFLTSGCSDKYPRTLKFEFPALILFSVVGMLIMVSASDLISFYLGIELQSLCLYVLAAFDRNNAKSSEAGVKYFVLGSIASGLLLFGMSFIYGYSGTTNFIVLKHLYSGDSVPNVIPLAMIVGVVFVIVGICFKIAAVPFHVWAPDVYEGAQLPVMAFFAIVPKVAAIYVLTNLLLANFVFWVDIWQELIKLVAVLSMFVGAFAAIKQSNIKRLLAYSAIGHAGFILAALSTNQSEAITSVLIYTIIYAVMSLGAFALLMLLETANNKGGYNLNIFRGLAKTNPIIAFSFAVIFLSMAGIPPLAGFFAKFYIILELVKLQFYTLSVLFVVASVIAAYYYLKIVKYMYFDEAEEEVVVNCNYSLETVAVATISVVFNILLVFTPAAVINFATINALLFNK